MDLLMRESIPFTNPNIYGGFRMKKTGMTKILMAAGVAAVMMAGTALAGTWDFADGAWRYRNAQGTEVLNSWVQEKGIWYYVGPDTNGRGALQTGWKEVNGKWYFLNPNKGDDEGAMITGWVQVDGVWYYLDPADGGAMAVNRDVNGYHLGSDGAYVKKTATSFRTASSPDDADDDDDFPGDDEDDETEDNGWDASDASNGPGLQVAKDTTSGPGKGLGYAYSTKTASSSWTQTTTPDSGGRTFPDEYDDDDEDADYDRDDSEDDGDEEDDEAGGSKEDFLKNQAAYYKKYEKVSTYEGDTGVNYEYNVTKITDADGETRTIVKKTKIEDEDEED